MDPVDLVADDYVLRQLRAEDHGQLVDALGDAEIRRWLWAYRVADAAAARSYAGFRGWQWLKGERYSWSVFAASGELAGEVGLRDVNAHDRSAEAVCWTTAAFRGRGLAVAALTAALGFGFGEAGLHRVAYRHSARNPASRRVAEKCGFRLEGTLRDAEVIDGAPHDLLLWSRLSTD
ncbi:GNAT family protein [Actinosynnema sp. NPDC020468]|uniref:GNAT family N-acetyltransferase n=1 Tax=Actinosynnema sp. NPDC020468 TaxID=3154488 RepID=UPI003405EAD7